MLKKFLLALMLSITALAANAQTPDLEQQISDLKERLALSDSQAEQVRPVLEQSITLRREILKKYGIDAENRDRASFKKLSFRDKRMLGGELKDAKQATQQKLGVILSEEQLKTYEEIQRERKENLREHMKNRN